jgi:hypothetical protein
VTGVLVVTDTRKARPRAASVYMSSAEARKLARTLTTHAKRGAR